jgi:inosine-uridine nucleoside N-ribohydrolase
MDMATHMHGSDGLGGVEIPRSPESAITEKGFEFIHKIIMSQPGQITWANTGSLTNLCLILREFPDLLTKFKRIVIMGGSTGRGNRTPAA